LEEKNYSVFPLAVGNQWEYKAVAEILEISSNDTTIISHQAEVIWEVISLENIFDNVSYKLETIHLRCTPLARQN